MNLRLHTYYRSSAAYRVRIALNLKGLAYDAVPVHLVRSGGEQRLPGFLGINPHGLIPVLEDDGQVIQQSLAIMEYLDEVHPTTSLLPGTALDRAMIRQFSLALACDVHPVNNLRVVKYLGEHLGASDEDKRTWMLHWMQVGLAALETDLQQRERRGDFCWGDAPTMADCCLIPQLYNARRWGLDLAPFPHLTAIETACQALPAFKAAHPDQQADCPD